jgi:hypothetical protein
MSCIDSFSDRTIAGYLRGVLSIAIAGVLALSMIPGVSRAGCAPRPGAPGRWTLQSHAGVSWLVTPCGERFFSIGVNTLIDSSSSQQTSDWAGRTAARLRTWSFNTAGAFSSPNLPLPSVPDLELGSRVRFHWADPFDPSVEERVMADARAAVVGYKASAYRIGYFPDNEIGWWNGELFSSYIKRSGASYSKRILVDLIRRHYGRDWHRFTHDFVVSDGISSFPELLRRSDAQARLRPGGNGIRVVREWTALIARHYYEIVNRAIRQTDPEALIFCDRLPGDYDPDAVRTMAPFIDAVATNYNVDSPDGWIAHYYFDGLRQLKTAPEISTTAI